MSEEKSRMQIVAVWTISFRFLKVQLREIYVPAREPKLNKVEKKR